ncbi:hypothetical protein GCM10022215_09960 [Nocardioides fonticola]|uniref:AB hydrolase-1 domain-containing protein n=1 Tax=Nocardioides fonticola TaxID=450363 RepID=A0ABP7XDY1_9ACTN
MTTLLLLHGLGGDGGLWAPLLAEARWPGPVVDIDLDGHGGRPAPLRPAIGTLAAGVAARELPGDDVVVLGHSLGGAVGVLLATGLYGVRVRRLAIFGVKDDWDPDLVARLHRGADAPARTFATREEALERAALLAGVRGEVEGTPVTRGVAENGDGTWSTGFAPSSNLVAGQRVAALAPALTCPLLVVRGGDDPLVTPAEAAAFGIDPVTIAGAGHHPHLTHPADLWAEVGPFLREGLDA